MYTAHVEYLRTQKWHKIETLSVMWYMGYQTAAILMTLTFKVIWPGLELTVTLTLTFIATDTTTNHSNRNPNHSAPLLLYLLQQQTFTRCTVTSHQWHQSSSFIPLWFIYSRTHTLGLTTLHRDDHGKTESFVMMTSVMTTLTTRPHWRPQ